MTHQFPYPVQSNVDLNPPQDDAPLRHLPVHQPQLPVLQDGGEGVEGVAERHPAQPHPQPELREGLQTQSQVRILYNEKKVMFAYTLPIYFSRGRGNFWKLSDTAVLRDGRGRGKSRHYVDASKFRDYEDYR